MMDPSSHAILAVIRRRMGERGETLQRLGKHLGSTHASASRLLNGRTRMTLDQLYRVAAYLEVPVAYLLLEADKLESRITLPQELETWLCQDARRYIALVALNSPSTVEQITSRYRVPRMIITNLIERLRKEGLLLRLGPSLFELTPRAKKIVFGHTREFYSMKARFYGAITADTVRHLKEPKSYWVDKEDRFTIAKLTQPQAQEIARQMEAIANQLRLMDMANQGGKAEQGDELHAVFMALKPITPEIGQGVAERP